MDSSWLGSGLPRRPRQTDEHRRVTLEMSEVDTRMQRLSRKQARRPRRIPRWATRAIAAALGVAALLSAVLAFGAARGLARAWTGSGLPDFSAANAQGEGTALPPGVLPSSLPLDVTAQAWNGTDRVTVLVMGLDYRDWESGSGPPRTDTMMLVSVDPLTKQASLLSIPRDLWVEIPGYGEHYRINTAFFLGEADRLPGGGPGLAMATAQSAIGVPIQYYAVIEFSAFERMIDEIGGIDLLVPERIKLSPIGRPVKVLEPGQSYHLDGPEALAYARIRKTQGGDFDRAQRQQQVVLAIKDRVVGFDMIPRLLTRAPALYQELAEGIRTNLSLEQMISLALLVKDIPVETIRRGVIAPPDMVTLVTLADGSQVLRPVPDKIRALRDDIFAFTGAIGPSIAISPASVAAQQEGARLAVLNGAGIEGIASQTADFLKGQGLNVIEVANADRQDYAQTLIIDYSGKPYTTRYLMEILHLSGGQILLQTTPGHSVDVAVILGSNWSPPR